MTDTTPDTDDADDEEIDPLDGPWFQPDRKRGVLTKQDRQHILNGLDELEGQKGRDARYRIRQRLLQSLFDFMVLSLAYPIEEYEALFESVSRQYPIELVPPRLLEGPLHDIAARLALVSTQRGWYYDDLGIDQSWATQMEGSTRRAMLTAARKYWDGNEDMYWVSVDIDVQTKPFDEEEMLKELVWGEPSPEDVSFYTRYGDLDLLRETLREYETEMVYEDWDGETKVIGSDSDFFEHQL